MKDPLRNVHSKYLEVNFWRAFIWLNSFQFRLISVFFKNLDRKSLKFQIWKLKKEKIFLNSLVKIKKKANFRKFSISWFWSWSTKKIFHFCASFEIYRFFAKISKQLLIWVLIKMNWVIGILVRLFLYNIQKFISRYFEWASRKKDLNFKFSNKNYALTSLRISTIISYEVYFIFLWIFQFNSNFCTRWPYESKIAPFIFSFDLAEFFSR